MRKKYVIFIKHIIYIAAIAVVEIIGCPFYKLFHITCPACGTTRAWLCALRGNFRGAFGYNPFFILIPVFLLLAVDLGKTQTEVCITGLRERRADGLLYFDTPQTLRARFSLAQRYGCIAGIALNCEMKE